MKLSRILGDPRKAIQNIRNSHAFRTGIRTCDFALKLTERLLLWRVQIHKNPGQALGRMRESVVRPGRGSGFPEQNKGGGYCARKWSKSHLPIRPENPRVFM